ncbi:30S ribosomal protein S18 [Ureaplasma ceti]|uniref:Small ribosomal subunit protein bS18 n=1 Tax=Ureaplasma ceti TaxID=3119530 RepID=A0ABP9U734_9BACT
MAPFNKRRKPRRKVCQFCVRGIEQVDYKDVDTLQRYINANYKITARRITGCCTKHQRRVANAIKRARIVALLPFVKE